VKRGPAKALLRKLLEHWAGDPEMLARIMWVSQQFEERPDFFRLIYDWFRSVIQSPAVVT
jgi:hypothetical protein